MSGDVGLENGVRAEILALLTAGLPTVDVTATLNLERLVDVDAMRKPCVGVIYAGDRRLEDGRGNSYAVNNRLFRAEMRWTVLQVWDDKRGAQSAFPTLSVLVETVRGLLHYSKSAFTPGSHYIYESTAPVAVPLKPGIFIRGSNYRLHVLMGNP